ncbi:hypothetical protein MUB24_03465 [Lederbergia sp. NSJ-179]|uniref:phage tail protein n=1 Tax=Lederbergia sp. NSJ-179 TaxID=2931402 RepID=UPI001FD5AA47|nr:hypothetical protein [Lederbergia sp. NSJ-179]MCJ7839986.1 hypothetical protein [Lederbergia sp. NSJ-179]
MSQIHILDGQNDLILDYVQSDDIIDDNHKKSLKDTLETYDFIAIGNRSYTEYLEKRNRLIIPDEDDSLAEFVIFEAARYKDTEGHKVQAFAHASYLELKKANIIYPDKQGKKRTASQHAGFALNDTGWQVGTVEASGEKTLSISAHTSPYEFLKHIAKEFNVELRFRVEHDGTKITGRYVDLLQRVGVWRGREAEFGRDLDSIRRVEKQDVVTALLGLGPEREDGTRIEVLVEDLDALERWGRLDENGNLKHLIEPYEIESERSDMTETEARQYTKTALNKRINTQVTYETTIVDLENVPGLENEKIRFGDTIRIKDTSFIPPLYLEARVFEQVRSIKTTAKKDIKLGDFIEYTKEDVNAIWNQLKEQIKNRVSYYEMVEHTYDRLTIDGKDETVFEKGKTFAEATGIAAEENAKKYAETQDDQLKTAVEKYADTRSNQAQKAAEAVAKAESELAGLQAKAYADGKISEEEARAIADAEEKLRQAKAHAETVAEQKAQSALDQAKIYSVAKTVYENKMKEIAEDIGERAPIEYVDGQIVHAIDNLEIGGRNLLRGTSSEYANRTFSGWGDFVSNNANMDIPVEAGEIYTFRVYLENDKNNTVNVGVMARLMTSPGNITGRKEFSDLTIKPGEKGYSVITFTVPSGFHYLRPFTIRANSNSGSEQKVSYKNEKLEIGNKATDWTPAPEDMFSEIEKKADGDTVYTIEELDNKFLNYVGITQYTADKDGIIKDLKSHGTRIGQNEKAIGLKADDTKVNQINNSLTQKIGNVEVKADQVTTRVGKVEAEVDGLEFGGRNLIPNTSNEFKKASWTSWNVYASSTGIPVSPGETITARVYYKDVVNIGATLRFIYYKTDGSYVESPNGNTIDVGEEGYSVLTHKVPTNIVRLSVSLRRVSNSGTSSAQYKEFKLEKGSKPSDWTPAPEDTDGKINTVSGRVETAEGEIKTLAGEVALKANETVVDSLEKRVTSAEGELKVLPGQINAKVSKDGVIGALNLTPETALIDFKRVKMTGELEAKHIKSLKGLNINNQFVVDANGKVTIGNQRITIDDKGIQIRRPDGAVAMDDGMMHNAYSVSGNDPHYMKAGISAGKYRYRAFKTDEGTTWYCIKGTLDGRGDPDDADVRDPTSGAMVFQRYEYIHSARYFVLSLWVPGSAGKFSVHFFKDNSDNLNNRLYWKILEKDFAGEHLCIVDVGKPSFTRKEMYVKFGWANSWGPASEKVEFRIQRVIQTDFV